MHYVDSLRVKIVGLLTYNNCMIVGFTTKRFYMRERERERGKEGKGKLYS